MPHISSTFAVSLWHPERGNQDSHKRNTDGRAVTMVTKNAGFDLCVSPFGYALLALDPFALALTLVSGKHFINRQALNSPSYKHSLGSLSGSSPTLSTLNPRCHAALSHCRCREPTKAATKSPIIAHPLHSYAFLRSSLDSIANWSPHPLSLFALS